MLSDVTVSEYRQDRWALERLADALLASEDLGSLDVMVRGHLQVKPDAVAYRGQVRYRKPAPMRYGQPCPRVWIAGSDGVIGLVTLLPTTMVGRSVRMVGCHGPGWHGRREVIGTRTASKVKVARKARVRVERATATATRGKLVSWWSMSERSLPRWWAKADTTQQATADTLEAILRTSSHDARVELNATHAVIIDSVTACVRRDEPNSRMMPIREYARRAALAGLTID